MKRIFFVLALLAVSIIYAQEWDFFDIDDIDSLFSEPPPGSSSTELENNAEAPEFSPMSMIRRRGFTLTASFDFGAGIVPGWNEAPWFSPGNNDFSWAPAFIMKASFDLDAQITEVFRVKSVVYYALPDFGFSLGEFFFDYSLYDVVFFRVGKYNLSWGISEFTNLLARVPNKKYEHDSFIFKADIPLGIGGFQLLAMTRADLINYSDFTVDDFGFGGKYNLALRRLDMNIGIFYQKAMPLRSFLSLKTTIGSTELYSEGLLAIDLNNRSNIGGAANIGFLRDFFSGKLTVQGELFFNKENNAHWYTPETDYEEAKVNDFMKLINGTVNLYYRLRGSGSPRLFLQTQYAPFEESARLVPGFRISPWSNIDLYLAVPMALGRKDGYYYTNTPDPQNRPFSVVFLFTLSGSFQFGQYF